MTGLIWLFDWSWVLLVFCLGESNLFCFIFLSFSVYLVATLITLQNKLNEEIRSEIDFFSNYFIEMTLTEAERAIEKSIEK